MPPGAARDCLTPPVFTATAAPGGDDAFDVHIDTGLDVISDVEAQTQDLVQYGWTTLVAVSTG